MAYKKEIEVLVKSYQDDPLVQEIISMWVKNPSKQSSEFGGKIFLEEMVWNLSHRYPEDMVRKKVSEVVLELMEFYRRDPEKVDDAIHIAYIDYGWGVCWARIEKEIRKNPQVGHAMVPVFDYLWETGKTVADSRPRGLDSRQPKVIDRILKDTPLQFEDLLKLGLFYKVTWVKKTASNEERFIVPDIWVMMYKDGADGEETEDVPELDKPKRLLKHTFKVLPVVHEDEVAKIVGLSVSEIKSMVIEMADVLNVTYDISTRIYTSHDRGPIKVKICSNCTRSLGAIVKGHVVKCQYCGMDNVGD